MNIINLSVMRGLPNINTSNGVGLNILKFIVIVIFIQSQVRIVDCTQYLLLKDLRNSVLLAANARAHSFVHANGNITILTTDNRITQRKSALPFEQITESVKKPHLAAFTEKKMV